MNYSSIAFPLPAAEPRAEGLPLPVSAGPELDSLTVEQKRELLRLLREQKQKRKRINRQVLPVTRQAAEPPDIETMQEVDVRLYLQQILGGASGKLATVAERLPEFSESQCRALLKQLLQRSWQGATKTRLSFAQQRCWFFDLLNPGSPAQNIVAMVRAYGSIDLDLIEKCMNLIVARHESLRTNFYAAPSGPVQVIYPIQHLVMHCVDMRAEINGCGEAVLFKAIQAEALKPFDLGASPLIRVCSFQTGASERVLVLIMHHIVGDEWSIGILLEELGVLYASMGAEHDLPRLPVQYADYAEWQAREINAQTVQADLSFWRTQLSGAPFVLEVPPDRPRPAIQTNNGAMETCVLPPRVAEGMKSMARAADCTNFMAALAAFYVLLYARTGQEDIVVGTDFANRNRPETSKLIGFFVNSLALRCVLTDNPTFSEVMQRVRKTAVDAFSHPEVPFQWVVEDLKLKRDLSRTPVFQVVFDLHNIPLRLEFEGIRLESFLTPIRPAKFDLTIFISESPSNTTVLLEYNTDLYDRKTAIALLSDYSRVIETVVACPAIPLPELCAALQGGAVHAH